MAKFLDSVLMGCGFTTCRSHKFLRKSRFSCLLSTKRQFCSNKGTDDPPENPKIEDLLKSSSPLESSRFDDFWASSPYPDGTVFRNLKKDDEPYEKKDSSTKSIIMFPGQGNQFVGMAKNLMKYPVAMDLFKTASDILGYDLLKICLKGPEHVLNDTIHCQPATFVCSLALLEKLKEERPWAISSCIGTCGYSLGELTALVFAGVMNFEIGLNVVKVRAEAMAECCKKTPGSMLTVLTGPRTTLPQAFTDAINHCKSLGIENPQCCVASYLFPSCKVVAGNTEAIDFLKSNAKEYGIRRHSQLPVSGAFHTVLMKDAAEPFKEKLNKIDMKKPLISVFSNVTARPYRNVDEIKRTLPKQIYSKIKWEQIMHIILSPHDSPPPFVYECGPGNSLTAVASKVNHKVSSNVYAIQL